MGAYIEGVCDGQRFLRLIREFSSTKPMVVLMGGTTQAGAIATASHSGALATSDAIWQTTLKQAGAVKVDTFDELDELMDTILALNYLPI